MIPSSVKPSCNITDSINKHNILGRYRHGVSGAQIGELEQELVWSLLAKPPMPPTEAKSNQAPDSGLFESGGSRGYTAGGPLSEKWSEIFPQEQGRRGLRLDDKTWTSYLRWACITAVCFIKEMNQVHEHQNGKQSTAVYKESQACNLLT